MGEVVYVNFGGPGPLLTKRQIASHPQIRRSPRWIEQRVSEGMPSTMDGNRRMFHTGDVLTWLKGREEGGADAA